MRYERGIQRGQQGRVEVKAVLELGIEQGADHDFGEKGALANDVQNKFGKQWGSADATPK